MKKTIILIFLLISTFSQAENKTGLNDQMSKINSLEKQLNAIKGKEKINTLIKISKLYRNISLDKSLDYANNAVKFAKNLKDKNLEALCFKTIGVTYYFMNDYNLTLENYKKAIRLYRQTKNKQGVANCLHNIGLVYDDWSDYETAIEYYNKSLAIEKELNNKEGSAASLNTIGTVYHSLGKYDKALEHYQQSLKIYEDLNDVKGSAQLYNNIGVLYKIIGNYKKALDCYNKALLKYKTIDYKIGISKILNNIGAIYNSDLKNYDKALQYYKESLKIKQEFGNKKGIAISLNNIGIVYGSYKKYPKALDYLNRALKIMQELNNKKGIVLTEYNIGDIYYSSANYKKAINYYNSSLDLARKVNLKDYMSNIYNSLSALYVSIGNHKKALKYYKQYTAVKDSIFNEESQNKIAELETKYEMEKKQQRVEFLTKKNEFQKIQIKRDKYLTYGLISIIVLLIIIAFMFVLQNKLKTKQKTLNLEQKLLRTQMNPHFIFNSLIAIQSFMYKNKAVEAGKYLSFFAKLTRLILNNSREEYISIVKEIQTLKYYLELQALRFNNKFEFNIEVDPKIDAANMMIPPMLAQPFIENSIEHGIKDLDTKGEVNIRLNLLNNFIVFEIQDNGIGIEKSKKLKISEKATYQSLAISITKERLSFLNKKTHRKIELKINELKDKLGIITGTKVVFNIPYKYV